MIVGLTGGIGCGKSTTLEMFGRLGWLTLDADRICHELYEGPHPEVYGKICSRWGKNRVLDDCGGINRKVIAGIVFEDNTELQWLNRLLHPLVLENARKKVGENPDGCVMFDVPLLFEAEWQDSFDVTLAVWCDPEIQRRRLLARGMGANEIDRRIKYQIPADVKLEMAGFGLINSGSENELFRQCRMLDDQLRKIQNKLLRKNICQE